MNVGTVIHDECELNMIRMREAELKMQEAINSHKGKGKEKEGAVSYYKGKEKECPLSNRNFVSKAVLAQRARRERERNQIGSRQLGQRLRREREKSGEFRKSTRPPLFPDLPPRPRQRARFEREKRERLTQSVSSSLNITLQQTPTQVDHSIAGRTQLLSDPSTLPDLHSIGGITELMTDTMSFTHESIQANIDSVQATSCAIEDNGNEKEAAVSSCKGKEEEEKECAVSNGDSVSKSAFAQRARRERERNQIVARRDGERNQIGSRQLGQCWRREQEKSGEFSKPTQPTLFPDLPPRPRQRARFEREKRARLTQLVSSSLNITLQQTHTQFDHSIAGRTQLLTDPSTLPNLISIGGITELMTDTMSFPHESIQANIDSVQTTSCVIRNNGWALKFQRAELHPMVEQMVNCKFRKYKLAKCGRFLSTCDKQTLAAIKKTGLRDLQNDSRTAFPKCFGNFPSQKETESTGNASQVLGAKSCSNVNPHLVYAGRKSDAEVIKNCIPDKNHSADFPQSEQFSEKRVIPLPHAKIKEPKGDGISPISPTPSDSTMNSCGNLLPDSHHKHDIGQLAGVNPAVPCSENFQAMGDQHWRDRFIQLQNYLKYRDNSNQEAYVRMVQSFTSDQRGRHAVELEKRAIYLLLEEERELRRMKVLNVHGKSASNNFPSPPIK